MQKELVGSQMAGVSGMSEMSIWPQGRLWLGITLPHSLGCQVVFAHHHVPGCAPDLSIGLSHSRQLSLRGNLSAERPRSTAQQEELVSVVADSLASWHGAERDVEGSWTFSSSLVVRRSQEMLFL